MNNTTKELYDERTSKRFYDERYTKGYMDEWPLEKKQRVFEIIKNLDLPDEGEALDFGCGNGVFTEVMGQALPKWKIYGTDISAVAVENARTRIPSCTFFTPSEENMMSKRFDFLLTHHVLEHVYNLQEMWQQITDFMKPHSGMLHILPCGNEGSFEYDLCRLRSDGINAEMENRFFYEDTGHVRRLNTEQLSSIAAESGFKLSKEYYGNQYHGAMNWITQNAPGFVMTLTEPAKAKNPEARKKLLAIRRKLMAISTLRDLLTRVRNFPGKKKTAKSLIGLAIGLPFYPVSSFIDRNMRRRAEIEWNQRNTDQSGSEMYLYFKR